LWPVIEWLAILFNHSKTGQKIEFPTRLDRFVQKKIIFLNSFIFLKRSRLADHSKTGQKCPVFVWLKQDGQPFDNWTQIFSEK
jgi:hypothetical protein